MGRPRKTEAEHAATGTLQPCRMVRRLISEEVVELTEEPPKGLRQDAKDAWAIAVRTAPKGSLSATALSILERWARSYASWRRLSRDVEDNGEVDGDSGALRPQFTAMIKYAGIVSDCEKQLGFTPITRARVYALEKEEAQNEFGSF